MAPAVTPDSRVDSMGRQNPLLVVVMTTLTMLVLKKCGGVRVSDIEEAEDLDTTNVYIWYSAV